eukprot:4706-Hanusia_phi.AAC.1
MQDIGLWWKRLISSTGCDMVSRRLVSGFEEQVTGRSVPIETEAEMAGGGCLVVVETIIAVGDVVCLKASMREYREPDTELKFNKTLFPEDTSVVGIIFRARGDTPCMGHVGREERLGHHGRWTESSIAGVVEGHGCFGAWIVDTDRAIRVRVMGRNDSQ